MLIDKEKFATHLRKNAAKLSQRKCATYVRRALEAGGARTVGHPVDAKDYGPVLLIWLCLTTSVAYAVEQAPTTLLVPVVGVRYTVATASFDPLPDGVISMCPGLVADENMRVVFWIYATARDRDSVYYVIGGYGVRARPDLPVFLATRYRTWGQSCRLADRTAWFWVKQRKFSAHGILPRPRSAYCNRWPRI